MSETMHTDNETTIDERLDELSLIIQKRISNLFGSVLPKNMKTAVRSKQIPQAKNGKSKGG